MPPVNSDNRINGTPRTDTKYSLSSWKKLETCHPKLQSIFIEADQLGMNITIVSGRRDKEEQNRLHSQGKSQLVYPESKHNKRPSEAVDAIPYIPQLNEWPDKATLTLFAGQIDGIAKTRGIDLRLGVDWDGDEIPVQSDESESFFDGSHVELPNP